MPAQTATGRHQEDESEHPILGLKPKYWELVLALVSAVATATAAIAAWKATSAAKQAIVGLDRPYLMVGKPVSPTGQQGIHGPEFELSNFGRSPAAASKLVEALSMQPREQPPKLPDTGIEVHELDGIFVAPAASHLGAAKTKMVIDRMADVLNSEKRLIWMGELDYADVMGHGYRTTFCYEWTSAGWRMTGGNALNQSRQLDA